MKKFLLATISTYRLVTLLSLCLGLFAFPAAAQNSYSFKCMAPGFTSELFATAVLPDGTVVAGTGDYLGGGYGFDNQGNVYATGYNNHHLYKMDISKTVPQPGNSGMAPFNGTMHSLIDLGVPTYNGSPVESFIGNFTSYPDGSVYAQSWGLGIVKIDLATAKIIEIAAPTAPRGNWGIYVDPQLNTKGHHNILYQDYNIGVIDPIDHQYLGNIPIGTDGMAIDGTGNYLFTTGGMNVWKRVPSNPATPDLPAFTFVRNNGGNPDGMSFATIGTQQVVVSADADAGTVTEWTFPNNDFSQPATAVIMASGNGGNTNPGCNGIGGYGDQIDVGADGYLYVSQWNIRGRGVGTVFADGSTSPNASIVRFGPAGRFLPPTHSDNISLTPTTDTKNVGNSEVLTATLLTTDLSTNKTVPVANTSVTFTVAGGPDVGQSFTGSTDANGKVTFTLQNHNVVGDDVVHAQFVDGNHNTQTSNNAVISFVKPPCDPPTISGVNVYIQQSTPSNSCSTPVSYNLNIGGTSPVVTYTFTTPTGQIINGTGTGSGQSFDKGVTNVSVSASNSCGSTSVKFTVTIVDDVKPVVLTKNITVQLDATGHASITAAQLDNGSNDNCGSVTLSISNTGTICGTAAENGLATLQAPPGTVIKSIDFASYGNPTGSCGSFALGSCNASNSVQVVSSLALNKNYVQISASNSVFGDPCNGTVKNLAIQATYGGNATPGTFDCSNIGANQVTLIVTDAAGNASSALATVTVVDKIPPALPTLPDISAQCSATAPVPTTSDNCGGTISGTTSDPLTYNTQGTHVIHWTFTDPSGNSVTANQNVIIHDVTPPVIPTIADVKAECSATVTVPTTTDNCAGTVTGTTSDALSYNTQGTHVIHWSFNDGNGNISTAVQNVIIKDVTPPVINCPAPVNVNSDPNKCGAIVNYSLGGGEALATAVQTITLNGSVGSEKINVAYNSQKDLYYLARGGYSGLPIETFSSSGTLLFTTASSGSDWRGLWWDPNTNKLEGNPCSSCPSNGIRIQDLDANGYALGTGSNILPIGQPDFQSKGDFDFDSNEIIYYNNGSIYRYSHVTGAFIASKTITGLPVGTGSIMPYFIGYTGLQGKEVIIYDLTNNQVHFINKSTGVYVSSCKFPALVASINPFWGIGYTNGQLFLNDGNSATTYGFKILNLGGGISDNCSGNIVLTQTSGYPSGSLFPIGTTTNSFTATDAAGNSATCSFKVTVTDNEKPVITTNGNKTLKNDPNVCGASVLVSATAKDNCTVGAPTGVRSDGLALNAIYPVGTTTITWTVTDANGNAAIPVIQTIVVADNEKPLVHTKDITIKLDGNGNASITTDMINNNSTDNCGIATYSLDKTTFDCSNVDHPYTATLTVKDIHGNVSSATAVVTVLDKVAPVVHTQDITIQLDGTGNASITPDMINNKSTDNCGIATYSLDKTTFDCSNVDHPSTVTLTVTDIHGNASSATAVVTVLDKVAPVVHTQDITIQLDGTGNATITPDMINNKSTDNCGIATYSLDKTTFDCSNVDHPSAVTLTVTDIHGNASSATAVVTVLDKVAPVVHTQDITIQLDGTGNATITPDMINNKSTDNCGIATYSLDKTTFDCSNVDHPYTVTLTVTDIHGNASSATAVVTVLDKVAPVVHTQDITILLDGNGNATITPDMINNKSTDNCGIATYSLDKTTFDCSNVDQPSTVTLTVTDIHGNASSATAVVTVLDKVAPVVHTQDITIQLDGTGNATITPDMINNKSTDNCGIATYSLDKTTFDCSNVDHPSAVTLTVTDIHGNASSATAVVTVLDKVAPVVHTQDITIQLDGTGNATITPDMINNKSTDNCGIATYSLDKTTFDCSNVDHPYTVTLTVTDIHGNASSATAVVTVLDKVAPVVHTQDITILLDGNGNATITPDMINNKSTDNCGIATYSLDKTTFDCSNVDHPYTVTLTVTDIHGNASSATAVVTVLDKVAPVLTTPTAQVFCANYGGVITYNIPRLKATDNCGIASTDTLFAVTGATTRNGSGTNASGIFNIGVSTITWTVKDIHGNVSTSTTSVTINPLPVASLTASNADAFCNKLNLTGSSTQKGPFSYQWYNPAGTSAAVTQVLQLGLTDSSGVYKLFTTDRNGCTSEFPATYTYSKENIISNYTIVGFREVDLGINNNVQTGSVGVTAVRGQAEVRCGVSIASPGAFLKSARIDVDGVVNVPKKIFAPASPLLPTMIYNTTSTNGLPYYQTRNATTATVSGNYSYVYISKGSNITLTGNTFGQITVEKGANVTFTTPVVNIGSLNVGGKGDHGDGRDGGDDKHNSVSTATVYSNIHFNSDANVLVSSSVYFGLNTIVNAEHRKVSFYVGHLRSDRRHQNDEGGHEGDYNDNDETSFTVVGGDTKVTANVYAPNGHIQVQGSNHGEDGWNWGHGDDEKKNTPPPTAVVYMTGLFIANTVESDSKGVIWNSFDCGTPQAPQFVNAPQMYVEAESKLVDLPKELTVKAAPNPTTNFFMLTITSNDVKTDARVRVMDAAGRPLNQFNKVLIGSSVTFGQSYTSGSYFAEVTQGTQHKVVKLIKLL